MVSADSAALKTKVALSEITLSYLERDREGDRQPMPYLGLAEPVFPPMQEQITG